jgi:hypothetical protein
VHQILSGAQASVATNSLLSGITKNFVAKIHRTIRCAPDCPMRQKRPRQRSIARSARNQRATRGQSQRSPDRTGLSGVHWTLSGVPREPQLQRSALPNKERIAHCSCPVVHQTVRCAHGQKAIIAYQMELKRLLAVLGL